MIKNAFQNVLCISIVIPLLLNVKIVLIMQIVRYVILKILQNAPNVEMEHYFWIKNAFKNALSLILSPKMNANNVLCHALSAKKKILFAQNALENIFLLIINALQNARKALLIIYLTINVKIVYKNNV